MPRARNFGSYCSWATPGEFSLDSSTGLLMRRYLIPWFWPPGKEPLEGAGNE